MLRSEEKLGFTLVELLIAVAIIGILSTVGIPTYKRLIQKARKSEAKILLGGVVTAEEGFFAEWGFYGNNLRGIGFEVEGGQTKYYNIGFNGSIWKCVDNPVISPTVGIAPNFGSSFSRLLEPCKGCPLLSSPWSGSELG